MELKALARCLSSPEPFSGTRAAKSPLDICRMTPVRVTIGRVSAPEKIIPARMATAATTTKMSTRLSCTAYRFCIISPTEETSSSTPTTREECTMPAVL